VRAHRELLLNYFKAKKQFSSGIIEGLNNKAKVTMRNLIRNEAPPGSPGEPLAP
jgi:transposase